MKIKTEFWYGIASRETGKLVFLERTRERLHATAGLKKGEQINDDCYKLVLVQANFKV